MRSVLRVGLTGGIGSGKSAVADRLARHGAVVIDSDVLAREVVDRGSPGLEGVVEEFGPQRLAGDGSLDRPAMGALVFANPDARRRLEAIVHPLVRARGAELERAAPPGAVVVHVIPLLVETGQADKFDVLVLVDVPTDVQVQRLMDSRGMSGDDARARIAAQASRERRLAAADHVLDNSGRPAELDRQVDDLWRRLVDQATSRIRADS